MKLIKHNPHFLFWNQSSKLLFFHEYNNLLIIKQNPFQYGNILYTVSKIKKMFHLHNNSTNAKSNFIFTRFHIPLHSLPLSFTFSSIQISFSYHAISRDPRNRLYSKRSAPANAIITFHRWDQYPLIKALDRFAWITRDHREPSFRITANQRRLITFFTADRWKSTTNPFPSLRMEFFISLISSYFETRQDSFKKKKK